MGRKHTHTHCCGNLDQNQYIYSGKNVPVIQHAALQNPLYLYNFYRFCRTVVVFLCTHSHRAYFLFQYRGGVSLLSFSSMQTGNNADRNSHLWSRGRIRFALTCASNPNKLRRKGNVKNTGATVRTAKSGFLSTTCVQSGLAADNMKATRRRSCRALRLSVP